LSQFKKFQIKLDDYFDAEDSKELAGLFVEVVARQFGEKIEKKESERDGWLTARLTEVTGLKPSGLNETFRKYRRKKVQTIEIAYGLYFLAKVDEDFSLVVPEIERVLFGEVDGQPLTMEEVIGLKLNKVLSASEIDHPVVSELDTHLFDYSHSDNSRKLLTNFTRTNPFENNELNIFEALHWRAKLTRLFGRDEEFENIRNFISSAIVGTPKFVILSGVGGSGKTRLASELAEAIGSNEGWNSGFLPRSYKRGEKIDVGQVGSCIFIDYPEERTDLICDLIKRVSDSEDCKIPVCLVLVTRETAEDWFERLNVTHLNNCLEVSLAKSQHFSAITSERLCTNALKELRELGLSFTPPRRDIIANWLVQSPSHRLPLFSIAACVHAALEPEMGFSLSSSDTLIALAKLERTRVRSYSARDLGDPHLLEKLLCFSLFVNDGLSREILANLNSDSLLLATKENELVNSLAKTPYWSEEDASLIRLEPDRAAAAFIYIVFDWNAKLIIEMPWLSALMDQEGQAFFPILDRLLFDISFVSENNSEQLANQIRDAIPDKEGRANLNYIMDFPKTSSIHLKPIQDVIFSKYNDVPASHFLGPFSIGFKAASLQAKLQLGLLDEVGELAENLINDTREEISKIEDQPLNDPSKYKDYANLTSGLNAASVGFSFAGKHELALQIAVEAVHFAEQIDHSIDPRLFVILASAYATIAQQYVKTDQFEKAYEYANKAIIAFTSVDISKNNNALQMYALVCLTGAKAKLKLGYKNKAKELLYDAKRTFKELSKNGSKGYEGFQCAVFENLINITSDEKQLSELSSVSDEFFEFIMNTPQKVLANEASKATWWMLCGASEYLNTGDSDTAIRLAKNAKQISERMNSTPIWLKAQIHLWLAYNLWVVEEAKEAEESFFLAMQQANDCEEIPDPVLTSIINASAEFLALIYTKSSAEASENYTDCILGFFDGLSEYNSDAFVSTKYAFYDKTETLSLSAEYWNIFMKLGEHHIAFRRRLSQEDFYKHHHEYCVSMNHFSAKLLSIEEYVLALKYSIRAREEFVVVYESDKSRFGEAMEDIIFNCRAIEEKIQKLLLE